MNQWLPPLSSLVLSLLSLNSSYCSYHLHRLPLLHLGQLLTADDSKNSSSKSFSSSSSSSFAAGNWWTLYLILSGTSEKSSFLKSITSNQEKNCPDHLVFSIFDCQIGFTKVENHITSPDRTTWVKAIFKGSSCILYFAGINGTITLFDLTFSPVIFWKVGLSLNAALFYCCESLFFILISSFSSSVILIFFKAFLAKPLSL